MQVNPFVMDVNQELWFRSGSQAAVAGASVSHIIAEDECSSSQRERVKSYLCDVPMGHHGSNQKRCCSESHHSSLLAVIVHASQLKCGWQFKDEKARSDLSSGCLHGVVIFYVMFWHSKATFPWSWLRIYAGDCRKFRCAIFSSFFNQRFAPPPQKTTKNYWKLPRIAWHCPKLPAITANCPKRPKIAWRRHVENMHVSRLSYKNPPK